MTKIEATPQSNSTPLSGVSRQGVHISGDWVNLTPEQISQKEQRLESMKQMIESLTKTQHVEILKILKKNPAVKINENRNGVYINLSYVMDEVIEEIAKYLDYIKEQERNLEQFELKKEECRNLLEEDA